MKRYVTTAMAAALSIAIARELKHFVHEGSGNVESYFLDVQLRLEEKAEKRHTRSIRRTAWRLLFSEGGLDPELIKRLTPIDRTELHVPPMTP